MSFKDLDIGAALTRLAERKIEQAISEGKFDKIEGMGKPLDLEPLPAEENARMRWWALRILKQNDVKPDEVEWRKRIELIREDLETAETEHRVRELVQGHNVLVRKLNTLGTNALPTTVSVLSLDGELARLKGRLAAQRIADELMANRHSRSGMMPWGAAGQDQPISGSVPRQASPLNAIATCDNSRCRNRNARGSAFCSRCGTRLADKGVG